MKLTTIATTATLATTLFAAAATAEDFTACTKDGKTATFSADVIGSLKGEPSLSDVIRQAWRKTAPQFDSSEIEYSYGLLEFNMVEGSANREASEDASMQNIVPPKVSGAPGSCKPM